MPAFSTLGAGPLRSARVSDPKLDAKDHQDAA